MDAIFLPESIGLIPLKKRIFTQIITKPPYLLIGLSPLSFPGFKHIITTAHPPIYL